MAYLGGSKKGERVRMDGGRYRAFISYSHRDSRWASWLHRALESYRPPKPLIGTVTQRGEVPKRLAPIFRDRDELASATDLGTLLNAALAGSACQVVICSPQAAQSKWVNEEILAFKRLGREDRIFCLIVGGEPNGSDMPGRSDEECFPPALRFRLGPDGNLSSERTEPIAADARPGKDGKNNAKLKLIAGLLGVGFDALKRREQQRRQRRLFLVTCGAMTGMVLAIGLSAYALIQRSAAQRQAIRAEAEAEAAKQTTKILVNLFRISDPSEARGNSVTAREMLDQGAARVDRELAKQPAIQATLMDTLGTVYVGLGLYGQARPLLDRAVATRRRLDAESPALSESLAHAADLMTLQADYAAAEKAYREALALQAPKPGSPQNQAALPATLHGLGTLLTLEGRYTESERTLREALARQRQLFAGANADVARTLQDLARALAEEGNLKEAIPMMESAVAMERQLRGAEPHPRLADVITDLGSLRDRNGDYGAAENLFREALAMNRRLLGAKHPDIAVGLNNLAGAIADRGDLIGAESTYREALAMQRELLGNVHPEVANTLNNIAFMLYDRGERKGAMATELESLAIYRQLFPAGHPSVASVMNRIGFWLTQAGEYADADRYIREALAMRRRLLGDDSHVDVASSLTNLAVLLVATGKYQEALVSARDATDIYTAALSPLHWKTAIAESAEGAALTGLGQYPPAEKLLVHSTAILNKDPGVSAAFAVLARGYLDRLHRSQEHTRVALKSARGLPDATVAQPIALNTKP
jgi:tetratricopeptide (TPR) repeat protein